VRGEEEFGVAVGTEALALDDGDGWFFVAMGANGRVAHKRD
jgi:hypothetical protein